MIKSKIQTDTLPASAEFDRAIWLATGTQNAVISGNIITGLSYTGTSSYAPIGINVSPGILNCNVSVTGNTVTGFTSSGTGTTIGMYVYSALSGVTVTNNRFSNIKNTNTTGYGAAGITLGATGTTAAVKVNNNFIFDVAAFGFNGYGLGDNGNGIVIDGGGGYDIDFNSVLLNTNQTLTGGHRASCVLITSNVTASAAVNMRNNVLANLQTVGNANSRLVVAVAATSGAAVFGTNNYNDYYAASNNLSSTGTNASITNTLAQLQTSLGGNANSKNVQPVFVSATDLHLSTAAGNNWCLDGAGIVLPGITTDIDGQTRSTGVAPLGPDMGADEFSTTGTAVATPASQNICTVATITPITYTGTGTTFTWTRNNTATVTGIAASGTGSITGSLTNTTNVPVTVTFTIVPANAGGCAGPSFTATVQVYPPATATALPASQSACSNNAITPIILSGAISGTVFNWTRDNTATVTGIAAGGSGDISGTLVNTTASPVTVTFTIIPTANGCAGTAATATVTVNPLPAPTAVFTQPTTCTSTDGAIDITVPGAGPYSYSWTGSGVIPGNEDQTGLTAGNYSVTVTNTATNCSSTTSFTLTGPGGCAVCPTIPTLASNPTPATCIGSNVALTASGLTSMGVTYGIEFKYFTAPTATPYTGGTTIATVANGSLTGGGTQAATTTTFATAGTYYVYAILSPLPSDPACRPSATTTVNINPTPTVNAVANQVVCNNGNTTAVTFSGNLPGIICGTANEGGVVTLSAPAGTVISGITFASYGTPNGSCGSFTIGGCHAANSVSIVSALAIGQNTVSINADNTTFGDPCGGTPKRLYIQATYTPEVFNWTNSTPSIGLAAGGTGNIASFTGTNTTGAPVTATITVTPSYTNGAVTCTGTPTTFTITVNPAATINAVANQTVCNNTSTTAVNFSSPTTGGTIVYNWINNTTSIGLAASGTGNIAAFTATNTTTSPVTATITVTPSYTNNAVTCTGTPITFTITVNPTPAATISYAGSPYCAGSGTATVTQTGTAGGTYSSAAGLSINASTGAVTLGTSTPGTYTVTYTIAAAGGCAVFTTTASITITATPNATISYPAAPYCIGNGTVPVTRTGTAGGAYTSTPTGLTLDPATGAVNLNTSTGGTYTVTYTVAAAGGCSLFSTTASITINTLSVAATAATASNPSICAFNGTTDLSVVGGTLGTGASWKWYTGSCGGTLIGTGATLTNISLYTTTTFFVRAEGPCGNTTCANVTVTVNPVPVVVLIAANNASLDPSIPSVLNATVSPAGNYLYELYKDGVLVSSSINTPSVPLTADSVGHYQVRVTNIVSGCSGVSNFVEITVRAGTNVFITPNPNNGRFAVNYYATSAEYGKARTVTVYDARGSKMTDKSFIVTGPYTPVTIDITDHANAKGIYYVKITDASGKLISGAPLMIMR